MLRCCSEDSAELNVTTGSAFARQSPDNLSSVLNNSGQRPMMFVSAYPVCSPALPVSYWAEAAAAASVNPRVFDHSGPRRQHPLHDAFSADAVKRTSSSFYISDILYPSVIPLPGTLPHSNSGSPCGDSPHSPPARQTCDSRGTTSFPVVTTAVATTPVKSSDLKFGIDRILADDKAVKDRLTDGK